MQWVRLETKLWKSASVRRLLKKHGPESVLTFVYLLSHPTMSITGLLTVAVDELPSFVPTGDELSRALAMMQAERLLAYELPDDGTDLLHVYVAGFAKRSIGLTMRSAGDKRRHAVMNALNDMAGHPFREAFLDDYGEAYCIHVRAGAVEATVKPKRRTPARTDQTRPDQTRPESIDAQGIPVSDRVSDRVSTETEASKAPEPTQPTPSPATAWLHTSHALSPEGDSPPTGALLQALSDGARAKLGGRCPNIRGKTAIALMLRSRALLATNTKIAGRGIEWAAGEVMRCASEYRADEANRFSNGGTPPWAYAIDNCELKPERRQETGGFIPPEMD